MAPGKSPAKSRCRLYVPDEIPVHGVFDAPRDQAHHVAHVLRLAAGDAVTVFDGRGHEYAGVIERISKSAVTLRVGDPELVNRESPLSVTLAQGISSGERMDFTVQKAVELGITAIQPLATERSVVKLSAERAAKRVEHWRGVAASACEQSGRNRVPEVFPVASLTGWLARVPSGALRLTLSLGAASTLRELPRPAGGIVLLVGPEGGLSRREQDDAHAAGFTPLRLGPRVLRTETAALAALACLQATWGDF
ncbi:MAG: ribosomal methyltransferase RsmE [Betaproteobacteria bacterium]|nr:ribosomal methyltransferase RsmE [Betaproteobacteria bacterium]